TPTTRHAHEAATIQLILATAHKNGIVSDNPNVPSTALGVAAVTPIELVTAYAPFANGGYKVKPRLIRSISAAQDIPIWPTNPNQADEPTPRDLPLVMDPRDAYQVTSMLQSVVDYGTGRTIRDYGVRALVPGKTGTTNSGTDVWFVGYTPTVLA